MKPIAYVLQSLLWISIVISPTFITAFAGFIYLKQTQSDSYGLIWGALAVGAIVGIYWAEKVRKNTGLINFYGRLLGTPELNK
ncbi:hypothetical protein [Paraferrimonas sp. SM1919]|uniref:hypothetical protein n=1 Tax=Paraferrimonas sp. SM1919 TaxID=2662263 RepID=UPI0013D6004E|nr:hypothetical protein [Paraferrimonas sp. SM1919]